MRDVEELINLGHRYDVPVYPCLEHLICEFEHIEYDTGVERYSAIFRAAYKPSDFLLVQLDDEPSMVFDVYYAGWDRSSTVPSSAVGIHHPKGDIKKISYEKYAALGCSSPLGQNSLHFKCSVVRLDTMDTPVPFAKGPQMFSQQIALRILVGSRCTNSEGDFCYVLEHLVAGRPVPARCLLRNRSNPACPRAACRR